MLHKIIRILLLTILGIIPFNVERNVLGVWITSSDLFILSRAVILCHTYSEPRVITKCRWWRYSRAGRSILISGITAINRLYCIRETIKYVEIFLFFYVLVNVLDLAISNTMYPEYSPWPRQSSRCGHSGFCVGKVPPPPWIGMAESFGAYAQLNALGTFLSIVVPFTLYWSHRRNDFPDHTAADDSPAGGYGAAFNSISRSMDSDDRGNDSVIALSSHENRAYINFCPYRDHGAVSLRCLSHGKTAPAYRFSVRWEE